MHLIDVQNLFYNDNLYYKSEINYLNKQIELYKRALSDLENKKVSQIVKDLIYEKYHISNNRNIDILYGILKNDLFTLEKRLELINKKYSMSLSIYNAIKYRQTITPDMIIAIKEKLIEEKVKDVDLIKIMELIKVRNGNILVNEKNAIFSEDLFLVINMLNSGFEQIDVPVNNNKLLEHDISNAINVINNNSLTIIDSVLDFSKYNIQEQEYIYKRLLVYYQDKIYNLIEVLKNKEYYFDIELLKQIKDEYKELHNIYMFLRNRLDSLTIVQDETVLINLSTDEEDNVRNLYYSSNSEDASKCYFIKDLKEIREEANFTILDLIRNFKLGDNRDIKIITNGFIELKHDQVRIILKLIDNNNYSVMGVFIKKSDNDSKTYKKLFDRPIAIKDDEYSKLVEEYYIDYLESNKRKGTR